MAQARAGGRKVANRAVASARPAGGRTSVGAGAAAPGSARPGAARSGPARSGSATSGSAKSGPGGSGPPTQSKPVTSKPPRRRRGPRWARLCAIFGAILMVLSGGALVSKELLLARYDGAVTRANLFDDDTQPAEPKSDIVGPLNILLVGVDPRDKDPNWVPRADSVLIMHVPAGLDRGYLFSLPRDLWVDIPAFKKAGYNGATDKLAHAMYFGAMVPGQEKPNYAQGFQLLAKTVSKYTDIKKFDAGAIINFTGFKRIVDAMGGVTMYVDQNVKSIHMQPNGRHRKPSGIPGAEGAASYVGPRKEYKKGKQHLAGWEALDYTRQRYIDGGDYARQRHQQQFIRAMANQALSKDLVTNPIKLDKVLTAAGKALTFDGGGHSVVDFALALRNVRSESIVMVKLPGGGLLNGGKYLGEQLEPVAQDFFGAIKAGRVDEFMIAHPELINTTK